MISGTYHLVKKMGLIYKLYCKLSQNCLINIAFCSVIIGHIKVYGLILNLA